MKLQIVTGVGADPDMFVFDDDKIEITEVQCVSYDVPYELIAEVEDHGGKPAPHMQKDEDGEWCFVTDVSVMDGDNKSKWID